MSIPLYDDDYTFLPLPQRPRNIYVSGPVPTVKLVPEEQLIRLRKFYEEKLALAYTKIANLQTEVDDLRAKSGDERLLSAAKDEEIERLKRELKGFICEECLKPLGRDHGNS